MSSAAPLKSVFSTRIAPSTVFSASRLWGSALSFMGARSEATAATIICSTHRSGGVMSDADDRNEEPEYDEADAAPPLPWRPLGIGVAIVAALAGVYYGTRYFRLERDLGVAEQLIVARKYDEAVAVLDKAPASA